VLQNLVSVIVPTVGKSRMLSQVLDAIFEQSYPSIEVILVDDSPGSEASSLLKSISDQYRNHIKCVATGGLGLPAARNFGAGFARGNYLAFCDDDDIWWPGKIEFQVAALKEAELGFHVANYDVVSDDGKNLGDKSEQVRLSFPESLQLSAFAPPSSWLMEKRIFENLRGFDESFLSTEDKDFYLRASMREPILRSGATLWSYRISHGAISRDSSRKLKYNLQLIEKHRAHIIEHGEYARGVMTFAVKLTCASKDKKNTCRVVRLYLKSSASFKTKLYFVVYSGFWSIFSETAARKVS